MRFSTLLRRVCAHPRSFSESLSTSKAVQATAEAIGAVAELYDSNARTSLLPVHELVRESSYPYSHHIVSFYLPTVDPYTDLSLQGLIQTHRKALAQHAALNRETPTGEDNDNLGSSAREEAIARCETVLNITSAEIERVHAERAQDLKTLAEQFLDGQMQFHEKVCNCQVLSLIDFLPTSFLFPRPSNASASPARTSTPRPSRPSPTRVPASAQPSNVLHPFSHLSLSQAPTESLPPPSASRPPSEAPSEPSKTRLAVFWGCEAEAPERPEVSQSCMRPGTGRRRGLSGGLRRRFWRVRVVVVWAQGGRRPRRLGGRASLGLAGFGELGGFFQHNWFVPTVLVFLFRVLC